jgi:hypothetical protein
MFGNVWKNVFTCTRCPLLQNELQVYEIFIFKTLKVNENLKIIMYCQIMHVIIIIVRLPLY